jgi:hypothetical protein
VTTKEVKGGTLKFFWRVFSPEEFEDISRNSRFDDDDTIEHILQRVKTERRKKIDFSGRKLLGRSTHYSEYNLAPLEEVCEFLKTNLTVEQIDVSGNFLALDGAQVFAAHLADFAPVLKHVNLSNNELSADGGSLVLEALQSSVEASCFTLESVDIRFNSIPGKIKDPFSMWCKQHNIRVLI